MGQLISFFGEIPTILQEALNIALIAVSIIATIKGVVNVWKSGLIQLLMFVMLAGRSCSVQIGHHLELEHIILNSSSILPFTPTLCKLNKTYFLVRGPFQAHWGVDLAIGSTTVAVENATKTYTLKSKNFTGCFEGNPDPDSAALLVTWLFNSLHHDYKNDPSILCERVSGENSFRFQINISEPEYCEKILSRMANLFGSFENYCLNNRHIKKLIIIRNLTWSQQCHENHMSAMQLITSNIHTQVVRARRILSFFTWSLSDAVGNDMPGGYCLEKWMLIASQLKCFGNTAVAKCNLNHDSEFCDMLRLFDFNRKAIETLQNKTRSQLNIAINAINSLISDNLLMKNRVKELMDIPFCNYTKFWYVNHTKLNHHSLPRCWLVKNGSYLNESEFRNDWLLESDHLISEILSREYEERQGRTPLSLVDVCFWSTLFYTASIFLHLIRIPTHRHIVGEGCPKPHRLRADSTCACGLYKQKRRPLKWVRSN
ncbi:glycoprotein precursor [Mammarenavirus tamiamiense]|uniref:Pre-glycoprotein polyprotein GP complex n=2 Tax=Tamiami mammarenavirus (isolate Rat/United States/W 10777/1964) TaxID=3052329 RepID=GLYC_TAMVU|nr:glycoprotein precursor [Mammarenavirus tamiamiense]Q8AYY5.1 RecName: Full=Pre-glycoprotein polyprotein GP complex; Short=Pre-GP-C; Contains: RecName: Full=Stable signal peptide; Short=SSP; Contains: RecName: Full=Glycoprotein G1; Short=GP1; Contains: RecName: Full=Glycoprotein G2; Short=GP2 [Mammarenavirus tamiamiense]AAN09948.1 glycoprotein precursor [Mammarenavirus tamiamiense]AAN32955.1 glycoprotein precursor [Mammarenavirus tamiamiense]